MIWCFAYIAIGVALGIYLMLTESKNIRVLDLCVLLIFSVAWGPVLLLAASSWLWDKFGSMDTRFRVKSQKVKKFMNTVIWERK